MNFKQSTDPGRGVVTEAILEKKRPRGSNPCLLDTVWALFQNLLVRQGINQVLMGYASDIQLESRMRKTNLLLKSPSVHSKSKQL